ncbi:hypothetical protein [Georgenia faecalis]|uniref:Uncharacterized protein n=1 Tax=Georgenia faecalis TaxID=2483799 RepID=A0ABV9D9Q5_9MICO|nr:hypothetical protein [Georgenia faecalis]
MTEQEPAGRTARFGRSRRSEGTTTATTPGKRGEQGAQSRVSWVGLAVAAVLAAWQIIYSITLQTTAEANRDVYTSVSLFVSLILAVGAAVLGTVALSQRHLPRWPAVAAVAIGVYVFLVCVASWIGGLMASPV